MEPEFFGIFQNFRVEKVLDLHFSSEKNFEIRTQLTCRVDNPFFRGRAQSGAQVRTEIFFSRSSSYFACSYILFDTLKQVLRNQNRQDVLFLDCGLMTNISKFLHIFFARKVML